MNDDITLEGSLPVVRIARAVNSNYAFNIGTYDKTGISIVRGAFKVDVRPTGGSTNSYAEQIRANSGLSSGTFLGLDNETHLTKTGTSSLMSTRGVAVVDSTYTCTGGTIIGTYGQARADGSVAGSSFMSGLYGLIEASAAITASHVCSAWLDSHQANTVTGNHELLYMTNNGAATMDNAIYLYGGDKITSFAKFDTCAGMVSDTATTSGTSKKIKIDIDGTTYYINAYTG